MATPSGATATVQERGRTQEIYLYPHPLTLAREHAEAERVRLADTTAYARMCATWGRLGGLTTYYCYGTDYHRLLARRRWEKATAEELEEYRETKAGRS